MSRPQSRKGLPDVLVHPKGRWRTSEGVRPFESRLACPRLSSCLESSCYNALHDGSGIRLRFLQVQPDRMAWTG